MRRPGPKLHSMSCCAPIRRHLRATQRLVQKAGRGQRNGQYHSFMSNNVLSSPILLATAAAMLSLIGPASGAAADGAGPTYSKQVAPILYHHCTGCHRPGQIGFAQRLDSYEDAKSWASAIRDQ